MTRSAYAGTKKRDEGSGHADEDASEDRRVQPRCDRGRRPRGGARLLLRSLGLRGAGATRPRHPGHVARRRRSPAALRRGIERPVPGPGFPHFALYVPTEQFKPTIDALRAAGANLLGEPSSRTTSAPRCCRPSSWTRPATPSRSPTWAQAEVSRARKPLGAYMNLLFAVQIRTSRPPRVCTSERSSSLTVRAPTSCIVRRSSVASSLIA